MHTYLCEVLSGGRQWQILSHTYIYCPQLRLGHPRVGELLFCLLCPPCTALDAWSSLSRKLAYVPGPTFGFVKLLASSGPHCTKWADEQHRQAGFESRLVPDLPLPFIPILIGLRAFDLVSSRVWWEAATNTRRAAFLSPLHPLYSARPHGLVQSIFWHTCPDLDLGPW